MSHLELERELVLLEKKLRRHLREDDSRLPLVAAAEETGDHARYAALLHERYTRPGARLRETLFPVPVVA